MPDTAPTLKPLRVENSLDLLLVLLYAPGSTGRAGEPINGITRFQKLVFLLNQGKGPEAVVAAAKDFKYEGYKMGPFSRELPRDLDLLTSLGMLRTTKMEYLITDDRDPDVEEESTVLDEEAGPRERVVESTRYELTELGLRAGQELFEGLRRRDRDALVEFKRFFNSIPLRQLLIFVYQKFPQYTSESEIRGQLGM